MKETIHVDDVRVRVSQEQTDAQCDAILKDIAETRKAGVKEKSGWRAHAKVPIALYNSWIAEYHGHGPFKPKRGDPPSKHVDLKTWLTLKVNAYEHSKLRY